jgi:hypothetical protein
MLPPVAEVVLVEEPLVGAEPEVREPDRSPIGREAGSSRPVDAIVPSVDAKAVEVAVEPADGDLDRVMEAGEGVVGAPGAAARSSG